MGSQQLLAMSLLLALASRTTGQSTCTDSDDVRDLCANSRGVFPAVNAFSVDLYKKVSGQNLTNFALIPLHIASSLLTVCYATRGPTQSEIMAALRLSTNLTCWDAHKVIREIYRLNSHRTKENDADVFHFVHRFYLDNSVKVKPDFSKDFLNKFQQTNGRADFAGDAEAARLEINRWVKNDTNGTVVDLLSAGTVNSETQLTVVNSRFIQFFWSAPFDSAQTTRGPFTNADGSTSQIDFMNMEGKELAYLDSTNGAIGNAPPFQMIKLPAKWGNRAILFFLPKDPTGLTALEKSLTTEVLEQANAAARKTVVDFALPKFSLDLELDLQPGMEAVGIKALFGKDVDFSPMTDTPHLKLGKLLTKTSITFQENGFKSGTGSLVGHASAETQSNSGGSRVQFRADRPYFFVIRLEVTKFYAFEGRVAKL